MSLASSIRIFINIVVNNKAENNRIGINYVIHLAQEESLKNFISNHSSWIYNVAQHSLCCLYYQTTSKREPDSSDISTFINTNKYATINLKNFKYYLHSISKGCSDFINIGPSFHFRENDNIQIEYECDIPLEDEEERKDDSINK
jgi:hypothetical protein